MGFRFEASLGHFRVQNLRGAQCISGYFKELRGASGENSKITGDHLGVSEKFPRVREVLRGP